VFDPITGRIRGAGTTADANTAISAATHAPSNVTSQDTKIQTKNTGIVQSTP
jgi:hypothetical protein